MKELTNTNYFEQSQTRFNPEWLDKAQYALNPTNLKSWTAGVRFSSITDKIVAHLKPALLNSCLEKIKNHPEEHDHNSLLQKYYFIYCADERGNIRNLSFSPDVNQYVDQHLRNFMIDYLDRENGWEDAVKWYWNNSLTWTLEAMSQEISTGTQARMPERTWAKAYSKTLCYASPERFNQMFDIYAQNFVGLFMQSFHKKYLGTNQCCLTIFEEFLGLDSSPQSLKSILQPRVNYERISYITTLSQAMYQQLRKAVAIVDFSVKDTKIWPSASLWTPSGSSSGDALLKLSTTGMNDETVDVMDSICHLWLRKANMQEAKIEINADDILELRGLRKQKNGLGQRGGYKNEWRERIAAHMGILDHLWIKPQEDSVAAPEAKAFIIRQRNNQKENSKGDYTWEVRPGDPLIRDLQEGKRQTALISKRVLELDPYRQSYEKRAARYFSWLWRSRQSRTQYLEPIRVATLLEAINLEYNKSRSAKVIERFEKMLDILKDKGIIANWQYDQVYRNGREWLDLKLVVEPPQTIIDQYAKIRSSGKNPTTKGISKVVPLPYTGDQLKQERLRRCLTQLQAAEEIGINQTTLSKLELGRRNPDYRTVQKLQRWFNR